MPLVDLKVFANPLDVFDQIPGGVLLQIRTPALAQTLDIPTIRHMDD